MPARVSTARPSASECATVAATCSLGAAFTLRVYRHGMRRDKKSKQALAQLVGIHASDGGVLSPIRPMSVVSRAVPATGSNVQTIQSSAVERSSESGTA